MPAGKGPNEAAWSDLQQLVMRGPVAAPMVVSWPLPHPSTSAINVMIVPEDAPERWYDALVAGGWLDWHRQKYSREQWVRMWRTSLAHPAGSGPPAEAARILSEAAPPADRLAWEVARGLALEVAQQEQARRAAEALRERGLAMRYALERLTVLGEDEAADADV